MEPVDEIEPRQRDQGRKREIEEAPAGPEVVLEARRERRAEPVRLIAGVSRGGAGTVPAAVERRARGDDVAGLRVLGRSRRTVTSSRDIRSRSAGQSHAQRARAFGSANHRQHPLPIGDQLDAVGVVEPDNRLGLRCVGVGRGTEPVPAVTHQLARVPRSHVLVEPDERIAAVARPAESSRGADQLLQSAVVASDEDDRMQVEPGLRFIHVGLAAHLLPDRLLAEAFGRECCPSGCPTPCAGDRRWAGSSSARTPSDGSSTAPRG